MTLPYPIKLLIFPLISGLITALTIAAMLRMKKALPLDHPNYRSLHETPVPRTGGVGIMIGLACGWTLYWPVDLIPLLGFALTLSALSLVDDFRGLSAVLRFGFQIAISALFIALRPQLPGGLVGAAMALFAVVWMSNLYNFMDGSDGLAGGMAIFGFAFYALAAWLGGAWAITVCAANVAAAAAGFLLFNFHPARIFMGDAGSVPLGFLAAGLGLAGWQEGLWPVAFPVLVFSPFILDATITLTKRLLRGEKIWQAHRQHYFQRLVRLGFGHRGTALVEYGLMLACGGSAMLLLKASTEVQMGILLAWFAVYAFLAYSVDKAWRKLAIEAPIV